MSGVFVVPFCNRGTLKREYRNTNIAKTQNSAIKVKTSYKSYSIVAGNTKYITPSDSGFSGGTFLCVIPELVAASAG